MKKQTVINNLNDLRRKEMEKERTEFECLLSPCWADILNEVKERVKMAKPEKLVFNNPEEMEFYFTEELNEFFFVGDVKFNFNLTVDRNITVFGNIDARDITAKNIDARDVRAKNILAEKLYVSNVTGLNIFAEEIHFNDVCLAEQSIFCHSIRGCGENSQYFALNGEVTIEKK